MPHNPATKTQKNNPLAGKNPVGAKRLVGVVLFAVTIMGSGWCTRSCYGQIGFDTVPPPQPSNGSTVAESGFESSTLREIGADGGLLPRETDPSLAAPKVELPPLNLSAFGGEDLDAELEASTSDSENDETLEQLPLAYDQRESERPVDDRILRREKVVENYPTGEPRLIRSVTLDDQDNYLNDGPWIVKDRGGQTIAAGRYKKGVMNGQWGRRHSSEQGGLFETKPFTLFQGPFDSVANFKAGRLDGQWAIYDRARRTVFEINYTDGKRDGTATWFYPDTTRMRAATFRQGVLHGEVAQWDEDGRLVSKNYYHDGRKVVRNTSFYRPKVPRDEAYYLDVRLEQDGYDNWWEAKPAPYLASGKRVQTGQARAWYANQQLQYRGQFKGDKPVGHFFWWHPNGNRSTVGDFDQNGERTGRWIWWHENGIKQIEGAYRQGQTVGRWRSWDDQGQLVTDKDYNSEGLDGEDPLQNIESILQDVDPGSDDSEANVNQRNDTQPDDFRIEPAAEAQLPLPTSSSQDPLGPADGGDESEATAIEVAPDDRESLGPALGEVLFDDSPLENIVVPE